MQPILALVILMLSACQPASSPVTLVVHGGAGRIVAGEMSPEVERAYRDVLSEALERGLAILESGGTAVEAVVAAVQAMEDSPLFNAGRGAVLNAEGVAEMDAAVMDGVSRRAGAVAAVRTIRNPVVAAWRVMIASPYVLLVADGAEHFAADQGLAIEPPAYFVTERRYRQWQRAYDTVGAVALDRHGRLAAATSTGGIAGKRYRRVGDSALIGAGTYADERVAVSATGQGEYFIRTVTGHAISARLHHTGQSLAQATKAALAEVARLGGEGGLIALDRDGHIAMPFNTEGMYRGYIRAEENPQVFLYGH
ncbi:L-asparaginase/beta-aspartyl-peptidase [Methylomarinovum tepidoasis]|uniref:Isoaspartyl peptidase n=1 Tax=Methylomarinovum tepidoasis TaxID=2840183 RepID=A0AAU9CV96_9GAMM|nr:isoaspartyl peptidase/L-asparaginase [Methylomarinovum sp. IN45]BCX88615.1 L-asparaginase/beta-aspartyl-peptidase [Methylomarinovum sp. IN45]